MIGRRTTRTSAALVAALCLSAGSAHAFFDGLKKKVLLGFEAEDLAAAATFENERLRHDVAAAIGYDGLTAAAERAHDWVYGKARRQAKGVNPLDLRLRARLRHRWKALGVRATRILLVRALEPVADGSVEPHRPYLDSRWTATALRDGYLGVNRRSNVASIFRGFQRYSDADQAKIDALEERIGRHRLKGILKQAAHDAGYEQVRRLAAFAAARIRSGVEPFEADFDRIGDETRAAVLRDLAAELDPPAPVAEDGSGRGPPAWIQAGVRGAASRAVAMSAEGGNSGIFGLD